MPNLEATFQGKAAQNSDVFTVTPLVTTSDAINTNYDGNIQDNPGASGVLVIVKLGTEVGTCALTPNLITYTSSGGVILLDTPAALTAAGTYTYIWYPGGAAGLDGAGVTAALAGPLPRKWNIRLAKTTGDSDQNFPAEVEAMYLK